MNYRTRYDLGYGQKKSGSENIFQSGWRLEEACILVLAKFDGSLIPLIKYTGFSTLINGFSPPKTVSQQSTENVNTARRLLIINSNGHEKKQTMASG